MTTMLQTAEMTTVRQVLIPSIKIETESQSRVRIRANVVNDYAKAMNLQLREGDWSFPPVILFEEGDNYWIGDGFHRIQAAIKLRLTEIPADVRPGTQRDALLLSISANTDHGLPRTNADKRRAVQILLADPEWGQWSDREIARRCQVGNRFVGRLRNGASVSGTQMRIQKVKRGDTVYEMKAKPNVDRDETVSDPLQTEDPVTEGNPCESASTTVTTDCVGIPLRPEVAEVFASNTDFQAAAEMHAQLAKVVDRIAHSPGSELFRQHLVPKRENGQLTFCSRSLNCFLKELAAVPHCGYCPRCHIAKAGRPNPRCQLCHGRGWLSREEFELCPEHERQEVMKLKQSKAG